MVQGIENLPLNWMFECWELLGKEWLREGWNTELHSIFCGLDAWMILSWPGLPESWWMRLFSHVRTEVSATLSLSLVAKELGAEGQQRSPWQHCRSWIFVAKEQTLLDQPHHCRKRKAASSPKRPGLLFGPGYCFTDVWSGPE